MSIFSKPEYKEVFLPFIYDINEDDLDSGCLSIEAYGSILGEHKYCFASYVVNKKYLDEIEEMADLLKNCSGKTVKIILKIKNGIVKKATIDLDSLSAAYNDNRFKFMEVAGWGYGNKSYLIPIR